MRIPTAEANQGEIQSDRYESNRAKQKWLALSLVRGVFGILDRALYTGFMETHQQLFNVYELADKIVAEAAIHREQGRETLVQLAWDCSNAENARLIAERNRDAMRRTGIEFPAALVESLAQYTATARTAGEAFAQEYDAARDLFAMTKKPSRD